MGMRYVDKGESANIYFTEEDNQVCIETIRKWRQKRIDAIKEGRPQDAPVPEILGYHIKRICENLSYRYNFRNYHYREDMVCDAIMNLVRYVHCFDPDKIGERSGRVNFYSWATTTIDRTFGNTINLEKQEEYFKNASFSNMGGFAAFSEDEDVMKDTNLTSDMAQDFISRAASYEERRKEKAIKSAEKAKEKKRLEELKHPKKKDSSLRRLFKK
jgi:DNA-directed RNA polymerase specialized sigma24 family protein